MGACNSEGKNEQEATKFSYEMEYMCPNRQLLVAIVLRNVDDMYGSYASSALLLVKSKRMVTSVGSRTDEDWTRF